MAYLFFGYSAILRPLGSTERRGDSGSEAGVTDRKKKQDGAAGKESRMQSRKTPEANPGSEIIIRLF